MFKKLFFITGVLFLFIAITNFVVWFIIATSAKSFDEAVNDYINLYPKFIGNPITLTLLNILLLAMAIGCFIISIQINSSPFFRKVCYVLVILSGVLAGWNLFSLM